MDRQEYREIISEIRTSYRNKDYERVIMFARELPVKKIRENHILEMLANAYDKVGKPSLARTTLEIVYRRMPNGKQTAYKMALLSLQLKDIESAVQYYEDFCKIAPNDNQKFILKYQIATEGGLSLYDRIRILEEYTAKETDDKWMYELARLYHEAGMKDKCVQMCDDIFVWFSDGEYLKKALELKFAHKALNPAQQAMYERIMQEYIEDYEEPEPEPAKTYEEYEDDAEEFANSFLGAAQGEARGDTKPVNIPKDKLQEAEGTDGQMPQEQAFEEPAEPETEKPVVNVVTTKGEPADALAAEVATSIARNGVAQPRRNRKNIFYDFKLELSELLTPVKKVLEPAADAAPEKEPEPVAEVPAAPEVPAAEAESAAPEIPASEAAPAAPEIPASEAAPAAPEIPAAEPESAMHLFKALAPVLENRLEKDEKYFAEIEVPESVMAGEPAAEAPEAAEAEKEPEPLQTPPSEMENEKPEAVEGQLEINFDLLNGAEEEVEGQLSIDQLFSAYTSRMENSENRAAVAKVEAERLRQIRQAVEKSMPALVLDEYEEAADEMPAEAEQKTEETADIPAGRAVQVRLDEDTISFKKGMELPFDQPDQPADLTKDTVIFTREELAAEEEKTELTETLPENEMTEDFQEEAEPDENFRVEDEPELAYEDPVEKILRDFAEQEKAKELARSREVAEMVARGRREREKEIEIPAFLRDLKFEESEADDDLEEELEMIEDASEEETMPEEGRTEPETFPEEIISEPEAETGEIAAEPEDVPAEEPAPVRVRTDEELFDEIMNEVSAASDGNVWEELAAEYRGSAVSEPAEPIFEPAGSGDTNTIRRIKNQKSEEEVEEELNDLGDLLADVMGFAPDDITEEDTEEETEQAAEEQPAAEAEPSEEALQLPETRKEFSEEEEVELDDLGDALADIFGEEPQMTEAAETAETEAAEPEEETASVEETKIEEAAPEEEVETEEAAPEEEAETEEAAPEEEAETEEAAPEEEAEPEEEEAGVEEETIIEETADIQNEPAVEEAEEAVIEEPAEETGEPAVAEEPEEEAAEPEMEAEPAEEAAIEETESAEENEPEGEETEEPEAGEEPQSGEAPEPEEEPQSGEAPEPEEEPQSGSLAEDSVLEAIEEAAAEAEAEAEAEATAGSSDEEDDDVMPEFLLGDTQPLERIRPFVMSREMQEELAEFLLIDGMEETVTSVINNILLIRRGGEPTGGHLIVTGDKKIGKTYLTISMIKAVNKELNFGSGKVAKVQSDSLNGKNIEKVFRKIAGNDLIIENVGDLEEQTIERILDVMKSGIVRNMVVFEGNMLAVETIINNHPEVTELFKNRVDVSELTISQWADVACDYAKRKGYKVGDMALLALHAKIDEINLPTTRFGYEDIVNIMETAIERCEKRNTGKLFSAFSRKDGEEIELNEADFI